MAGNLFATAIIVVLICTLALLKPFGQRPTRQSSVRGAAAFLIAFLVLTAFASLHLCDRGLPVQSIAICTLCIGLASAAIHEKRIRGQVTRILAILSFAITVWGLGLIHETGYIANRAWAESMEKRDRVNVERARDAVRQLATKSPSMKLPAGWIEDVCIAGDGTKLFPFPPRIRSATVGRYWYTRFTGVYRLNQAMMGVWCPGGTAKECAANLELREVKEELGEE